MTGPDREPPIPGCLTSVVGIVAWLVIAGLLASAAHGQDDATVIARTMISEEGWTGAEGWASLGAVIRYRADLHHDGDLGAAARALSPRLHASPCTVTTRRWRCHLSGTARPTGLGATWTSPRGTLPSRLDSWLAALAAARQLLAGDLPDACRETPHAWGSPMDVARRLRSGERWIDAGCPGRNRYGRRLRRVE